MLDACATRAKRQREGRRLINTALSSLLVVRVLPGDDGVKVGLGEVVLADDALERRLLRRGGGRRAGGVGRLCLLLHLGQQAAQQALVLLS